MPLSAITKTDFEPKPATEAARSFARKVALPANVVERLSDKAKARVFRMAGVHKARLIQRVRDVMERAIRDGTDFRDVRRLLLEAFDSEGVPAPALHRLRLTFQQNAMEAYNDSRREMLDDPVVTKGFPFRQYLTVSPGNASVRPTHAALHGLVFRWNDPFWDDHTPPWEYGCRCTFVALTAGQVKSMGVKVRGVGYVRKRIRVPGQKGRGIAANAAFARGKFNLSGIESELRKALEESLRTG